MRDQFLKEGRINQKLQTRSEILKSAQVLLNKERQITLEKVAEHAGISRATIYRYFSNIELLTTEALLHTHFLRPEELQKKVEGLSLEQTVHALQQHYNTISQEHELVFRRYLSVTLKESIISKKKLRGARRVEALKLALRPFEGILSKEDHMRLIHISTLLMGIDALLVCKDVCELNEEDANKLLEWALDLILAGVRRGSS
jgi:AcrR family transcriptional regulator